MTARPGWVRAWAVAGILAAVGLLAFLLTPAKCNILSNCPWWSDLGVILISAPLVALAVLVAAGMTLAAWLRR